jgi:precorrin-2 dehydrogenase/sirohydrochlorin ferrochelatase
VIGDYSRPYYPAFLDLKGHLAVVIGGGPTAEEAVLGLIDYEADVIVVAPTITSVLDALVAEGLVEHEERDYIRGDLAGASIAFCASLSVEVCRAVYKEAEGTGCLVSVPAEPALCNYITPAVVQRGPFQLAVSTAGAAPEVARAVRTKLEAEYGPEWEVYVDLLAQVRRLVFERVPDPERECEIIFAAVADSDLLDRLRAGSHITAEQVFASFVLGKEDGDVASEPEQV